jgi:hypothetical protein
MTSKIPPLGRAADIDKSRNSYSIITLKIVSEAEPKQQAACIYTVATAARFESASDTLECRPKTLVEDVDYVRSFRVLERVKTSQMKQNEIDDDGDGNKIQNG